MASDPSLPNEAPIHLQPLPGLPREALHRIAQVEKDARERYDREIVPSFPMHPDFSFLEEFIIRSIEQILEYVRIFAEEVLEPSSLKRRHLNACRGNEKRAKHGQQQKWDVEPFLLYTLRHTCLTQWAPHMDPWTLAHLAGHRDMAITRRYIHPQEQTIRAAMEKARSAQDGHNFGHSELRDDSAKAEPTTAIN